MKEIEIVEQLSKKYRPSSKQNQYPNSNMSGAIANKDISGS
jgi:hypothetical protein